MRQFCVYIMVNWNNEVMYVGLTGNLEGRSRQHKKKLIEGFTKKYNVTKLVYYETYESVIDAIHREKQIKRWRREKKDKLVNLLNPEWEDLSDDW